ncbi:hypothetical protein K502DRAFT_347714 [Neoconidiobolus thromboides FSU 785]|nr:hypothetical protein K502DRAFT_347714 [Neoconidiobolus thromboides FSU 785]
MSKNNIMILKDTLTLHKIRKVHKVLAKTEKEKVIKLIEEGITHQMIANMFKVERSTITKVAQRAKDNTKKQAHKSKVKRFYEQLLKYCLYEKEVTIKKVIQYAKGLISNIDIKIDVDECFIINFFKSNSLYGFNKLKGAETCIVKSNVPCNFKLDTTISINQSNIHKLESSPFLNLDIDQCNRPFTNFNDFAQGYIKYPNMYQYTSGTATDSLSFVNYFDLNLNYPFILY